MSQTIRTLIEEQEQRTLSPFATLSSQSEGREIEEEPDPIRTCFMRDRDRILHSKPFRRLKHKTQVFVAPQGDHFRTRLTHTLEVAQVARTIGRALRLNEDLIEAIALGHDVGHTPFGHAGEAALDEAIQTFRKGHPNVEGPSRFHHSEQSLRTLTILVPLNLTAEVRQGIDGHSKGRKDLTAHDGSPTSTLEAAVVRIADRMAYLAHDLDDAVRSGIIEQMPAFVVEKLGPSHGKRLSRMVADAIENSLERPFIKLSETMLSTMNETKEWLFENVYLRYPDVNPDTPKAQNVVKHLFNHYAEGNLPEGYSGLQGAVDYVAGMTDRFAIAEFERLVVPKGLDQRLTQL